MTGMISLNPGVKRARSHTHKKKSPLNGRKPENSSFLRYKNTREIIINRKETKMVKDGED